MDRQQAKLILSSFRPDGADADLGDFAEALHLAAADRELGDWLARERAFDAGFSQALHAIDIPGDLRDSLIASFAARDGGLPVLEGATDTALAHALAGIQPPSELRGRLLAGMEATRNRPAGGRRWLRVGVPLAAAAGIALAVLATRTVPRAPDGGLLAESASYSSGLPINVVEASFTRTYNEPGFSLEHLDPDATRLLATLEQENMPCPCRLPPGLQGSKAIGCRQLVVDGRTGSLICMRVGEDGVIHMLVFKRSDIACVLPGPAHPAFGKSGPWTTAHWEQGDTAVLLFTHEDEQTLASLF